MRLGRLWLARAFGYAGTADTGEDPSGQHKGGQYRCQGLHSAATMTVTMAAVASSIAERVASWTFVRDPGSRFVGSGA